MNGLKRCKGNIQLILVGIFFIFTLFMMFSLYILNIQVNKIVYPIKQDMFYIVQNSLLSLNVDELSYFNYSIDNMVLKDNIETLIRKNYDNVKVNNIYYDESINEIMIRLEVEIYPLIFSKLFKNNLTINISDNIKLKLMEIK